MTDTSDLTRVGRLDLIRIIRDLEEEIARRDAQDTSKEIESLKSKLAACAGHDYAKQVNELQARMTAMVDAQLSRRVRAFHQKFGHPVNNTPKVPSQEQVQFRLKLITEEFFELLEACDVRPHWQALPEDAYQVRSAHEIIEEAIDDIETDLVHLPSFTDALADLDYVVEGTRAVFGIDGEPIMAEVQRSNMSKDPVYVAAKDDFHRNPDPTAKPTKPPGWAPPDVAAELMKQGWIKP